MKKILIYLVVVILTISLIFVFLSFRNGDYETVKVERGDLIKTVEISGKVVPAEEVNLSFNGSGNVIRVYKDVGDVVKAGDLLAEIDQREINSEILEAQANLEIAKAELSKISDGEISQIELSKDNLVKNLNKAFVEADSIVRNTVDVFFEDADTINAEFIISVGTFNTKKINDGREDVEKVLDKWKIYNSSITKNSVSFSDVDYVINELNKVDDFVSLISGYSSDFSSDGDVTQTQIDSYVASLATSRTTISNIKLDINSAYNSYNNLVSDIPVQNSKIENSRATVSKLQSKASDYVLRAPFDGLITENNLELGKYTSSSDIAFVLISDSPLEIEVYIPEINIVGVDVGDKVNLTFDALEGLNIEAVVTHIDPKETLKDGVVTYRTLIDLISPNENLRPGMTADSEIQKEIISDQIIIPNYTVLKEGDKQFVDVKKENQVVKVEIEILDKDNMGKISVTGDIREGDEIIIPKES